MATSTVTLLTSGESSTATTTVSFSAQPSGTLLVLVYDGNANAAVSGPDRPESSGWTLVEDQHGYSGGQTMWYLVADGSETSVKYTLAGAASSCYMLISLTSIDGSDTLYSSDTQTVFNGGSPYSTYATPIVPTSSGSQVAIAVVGGWTTYSVFTDISSWNHDYTHIGTVTGTPGYIYPGFGAAYLNLSSETTANIAPTATATASSDNPGDGQTVDKAIDEIIDGYPGDYTREWATAGGGAGSWIQLDWSESVVVDYVVLYDRPNGNDQITAGTLTFSDSSTVAVPSLNNDGSATTITFTPRATTSLRLTVNSVSGSTGNVGLSEFQAWGIGTVTNAGATYTPSAQDRASIIAVFNLTDGLTPIAWTI